MENCGESGKILEKIDQTISLSNFYRRRGGGEL
jgi:hypothetical protein